MMTIWKLAGSNMYHGLKIRLENSTKNITKLCQRGRYRYLIWFKDYYTAYKQVYVPYPIYHQQPTLSNNSVHNCTVHRM